METGLQEKSPNVTTHFQFPSRKLRLTSSCVKPVSVRMCACVCLGGTSNNVALLKVYQQPLWFTVGCLIAFSGQLILILIYCKTNSFSANCEWFDNLQGAALFWSRVQYSTSRARGKITSQQLAYKTHDFWNVCRKCDRNFWIIWV